jgi:hypothetical protein
MEKTSWEARCPVCKDIIDNPMCEGCLESEVEEWLSSKGFKYVDLLRKSMPYLEREDSSLNCIKCGNPVNICTFCFMREVKEIIEEKMPELMPEFNKFFGFSLWRDYSKIKITV